MEARRDERSLGQLFSDLTNQLTTLVRQEFELAKTEMTTRATSAGRDAAMIGAGGLLAHAGLLVLLAAAVLLLIELGLDAWLSALIVGVIVAAIGGFLAMRGRDGLKNVDMAPRRTVESIKDDVELVKERVK